MNILEKDIEELVYEAALKNPDMLYDRGLFIDALLYNPAIIRQYNLGNYGIMDLALIRLDPSDKEFDINIIELKKDAIDYKTLDQSLKYKKGIQTYMAKFHPGCKYNIYITLIGRSIDMENSNICFFPDLFNKVQFYKYSLDFEKGLRFEKVSGYNLNNPGLNLIKGTPEQSIKSHIYNTYRDLLKENE